MSNLDRSKLLFDSSSPGFKNNNIYTGTGTISGGVGPGTTTITVTVPLTKTPDMVQALFNGPTDTVSGQDPRPSAAWFRNGYVWVLGNNSGAGYTNYPIPFKMNMFLNGSTATIQAITVSSISATLTLTSTPFSYRIIDYSVL